MLKSLSAISILLFCSSFLFSQSDTTMSFEEYNPTSTLVVPKHEIKKAKFPFIDVHNHQFNMPNQNMHDVTKKMDKLNMAVMVNLSGRGFKILSQKPLRYGLRGSDYLKRAVNNSTNNAPGRFIVFTNLDFENFGEDGWLDNAIVELETDVKNGANGLKIYKNLGLEQKDNNGNRVAVDDERLDPIWEKCGELKIPVLIHSAEPALFWEDKDKHNERWLELKQKPNRYRPADKFASFEQIIKEQHNVFRKHPNTIFINAHLGWFGNDLTRLGKLMDELPNMYTEIGAVLAEIGRQPRHARNWFIKYQNRIMFGKDSWNPEEYYVYFRVLETDDEYFDYYRKRHAFWKMYGLNLPDDVLKKIYYKNALRIIPGIDKSLFPSD